MSRSLPYLLFLILCCAKNVVLGQEVRYQWKAMSPPTQKDLIIIGGQSSEDFWLHDHAGTVYHRKGSDWREYQIPTHSRFARYSYIQTAEQSFLCAAIDQQWKTHFFKFDRGLWSRFAAIHDNPIIGLAKAGRDVVYAIGDMGSILQYKNNQWAVVPSPITEHITSILATTENDIWVAASRQGVFHFDGKNFREVPLRDKENIAGIQLIQTKEGELCALTSTLTVLELSRGVFQPKAVSDSSVLNVAYPVDFAWKAMNLRTEHGLVLTAIWPKEFKEINVHAFEDSSIAITSQNGKLYVGRPQRGNCFIDLASTYDVAGSPSQEPTGAAFFHLNKDDLPELFVFTADHDGGTKLLLNLPSSPFYDITEASGLAQLPRHQFFTVGDFDKDGSPDIAFFKLDANGEYLDIFSYKNRYQRTITLSRTPHFSYEELGNLQVVDLDNDGLLDVMLVHYRSPNATKGYIDLLSNGFWGGSFELDTSLTPLSRGWNIQSVSADFDGDDNDDLFIVNKWQPGKLLLRRNGLWYDSTASHFDPPLRSFCQGAAAVDFDNDGNLDLFLITDSSAFQLYRNEGNARFREVQNPVFPSHQEPDFYLASSVRSINFGDIDNDGFIDIFYTVKGESIERNYLFWNDKGKRFLDRTEDFGIAQPYVKGCVLADIENDGDLDIFGIRNGRNVLWINNLNKKSFISVSLVGVKSNSDGLGTKLWIYDAGHLGDKIYLRGYRQTGSERFGRDLYNAPSAHLGVDPAGRYDLRILFSSGREKVLRDVSPGQSLQVVELEGFEAMIAQFPGLVYRLIRPLEIKLYSLLFILSVVLLYQGVQFGVSRFAWNQQLTFFLVVINLSLEVLLVYVVKDTAIPIKYVLPLGVLILGVTLPSVIFHWVKSHPLSIKSKDSLRDELLQILINFTHGRWALQNLNGILLLCKNGPQRGFDQDFVTQFEERKNTYLNLIHPEIHRIIALGREGGIDLLSVVRLEEAHRTVEENIHSSSSLLGESRATMFSMLTSAFYAIRQSLEQIRSEVFSVYASDPIEVVRQVTNILQPELESRGIFCERFTEYPGAHKALIKSHELGTIVNNCLQNSIQVLEHCTEKRIDIRLSRYASKTLIFLSDTGPGIPEELWEKIFERGYSGHGGTGQGLYHAREVLQNYGGRIYLRNSAPQSGTTFCIELNEVKQP